MKFYKCLIFSIISSMFLILGLSSIPYFESHNLETLEQLHIIFRHGDRTPTPESTYIFDPYRNLTYYPYGPGELTIKGKRNSYLLGREIRNRYKDFIPKVYYPPDLKAYTTNSSRTHMTLQSVLTGLYPPVQPNLIKLDLLWQPIHFETLATKEDDLLNGRILYSNDFHKFSTDMTPKIHQLYNYVEKHTGNMLKNSYDFMDIYDTLLVQEEMGLELPSWAEEIYRNGSMREAALQMWPDMIKNKLSLITEKFLKKVIHDSEAKIENPNSTKLFIYSAHDTNIGVLLGAFKAYTNISIDYLSHFFIELHNIYGRYAFKIYFRNGPGQPLIPIKIDGSHEYFCEINNFTEYVRKLYANK